MCFSAEADFAAAAVLTPLAIATLRSAPSRRFLPIAALPAVFAAHQFIEGFVWLGFDGTVAPGLADLAAHGYLVIAQMLLPLLVPAAMLLTEPQRRRRWVMAFCLGAGALTAARFGWILFSHEVGAQEEARTVVYDTDLHIGAWETAGYVTATCAAVLASSRRYLFGFGVANVIGLAIAATVRYEAVTSVWCLYAAFSSVLVLVHLRAERRSAATVSGPRRRSPAAG